MSFRTGDTAACPQSVPPVKPQHGNVLPTEVNGDEIPLLSKAWAFLLDMASRDCFHCSNLAEKAQECVKHQVWEWLGENAASLFFELSAPARSF